MSIDFFAFWFVYILCVKIIATEKILYIKYKFFILYKLDNVQL